jgi:hypothetical protein
MGFVSVRSLSHASRRFTIHASRFMFHMLTHLWIVDLAVLAVPLMLEVLGAFFHTFLRTHSPHTALSPAPSAPISVLRSPTPFVPLPAPPGPRVGGSPPRYTAPSSPRPAAPSPAGIHTVGRLRNEERNEGRHPATSD